VRSQLELAFASTALRQICESRSKAAALLGDAVADALMTRLADIEAADSLTELVWVPVKLQPSGTAIIEFYRGCGLTVVANHNNNPQDDGGIIRWDAVERIKITDIERP
jgi:hypothetical protein